MFLISTVIWFTTESQVYSIIWLQIDQSYVTLVVFWVSAKWNCLLLVYSYLFSGGKGDKGKEYFVVVWETEQLSYTIYLSMILFSLLPGYPSSYMLVEMY